MGHFCKYTSKVSVKWNQVVLEVTAHYKNKSELVYRETEKGVSKCHYIDYTGMSGYVVTFPGEKLGFYYGYAVQKEEPLYKCKPFELYTEWEDAENDLREVAEKRPDLKYLIKKLVKRNPYEFMKIVRKYNVNPHIEYLIEKGYTKLATDKRLEKLSKNKLGEVINWIKDNPPISGISLSQILFCIKYKLPAYALPFYARYHYQYDVANYLHDHFINDYQYEQYIAVCKKIGKNLKDKYWKYPSDFLARYDQVRTEERAFDEAQRMAAEEARLIRQQQQAKEQSAKHKNFNRISSIIKAVDSVDGYSIYVPDNVTDVVNQATILNQCLISCDYIGKMSDGKSILVFIKKNDERIATAEINYDKKLLQFYGDEHDRENCTPPQKVRDALETWIDSCKINKRRLAAQ